MNYLGSCHCGRISFEVEGDLDEVIECNCSLCGRLGALHWFVPRGKLRLLTPETNLATYRFGAGTIKHHFCCRQPPPYCPCPRASDAVATRL